MASWRAVEARILEFFRPASFPVAHQHPSRLVPVGQHPALADPAVDAVLVPGGAVGVAVDQARIAVRARQRLHRAGVASMIPGRLLERWRSEMKRTAIPLLSDLRLLDDDVLDRNVGVSKKS